MSEESASKPRLLKNLWAREAGAHTVPKPTCDCVDLWRSSNWSGPQIHTEPQDTECVAWQRLNELIDDAARDGRHEFSPGPEMRPEEWAQITTLPASIAKLKAVKHLVLYGSSLVRIPPEIGELTSLENFTPYTSYRLDWFPYEIRRCRKLRRSTISTRALYGNYKHRPPFPRLPQLHAAYLPARCSVCDASLDGLMPLQVWISLGVGTDVVPLLVHACSERCVADLPKPPTGYVRYPHAGGLGLMQPPTQCWEA